MWNKKQIAQHKKAAALLEHIKEDTFSYIASHKNCSEYEVQQYVLAQFKKYKLKSAIADPIVSFGKSTSDFHYAAPKKDSRILKKNTLIMLDIWARLNEPRAPFADITWMAFYPPAGGRVPKKIQSVFHTVLKARDASISLLRSMLRNKEILTGYRVEKAAMDVLMHAGYKIRKEIRHTTGHSLGTTSPHGTYGAVSFRNKRPLKRELGYTIEPGLYIAKQFGVRSEINFYVTKEYKLIITTPPQKKLLLLK